MPVVLALWVVLVVMMVDGGRGRELQNLDQTVERTLPPKHSFTLFQRISVEGLVRLLSLTKETEPLSCWCLETTSTAPPKAMCPIIVPTRLLHKVLEKTCGDGEVHCCQPRASKLLREDFLNMLPPDTDLDTNTNGTFSHTNNTVSPLGRAYHNYTDGGLYYTSDISSNDTATEGYLNNLVDNLASPLIPRGDVIKDPRPSPPAEKKPSDDVTQESRLIPLLKAVADYLLKNPNSQLSQAMKSVPEASSNYDRESEVFDSSTTGETDKPSEGESNTQSKNRDSEIGNDGASDAGKTGVKNTGYILQYLGKQKRAVATTKTGSENNGTPRQHDRQKRSTDTTKIGYKKSMALSTKDSTLSNAEIKRNVGMTDTALEDRVDLERGEFPVVAYDELGWFSRLVEVAMDGSLYVGLMVLTVLAAGALVSSALPFVTDSCLICALIGYANEAAKTEAG